MNIWLYGRSSPLCESPLFSIVFWTTLLPSSIKIGTCLTFTSSFSSFLIFSWISSLFSFSSNSFSEFDTSQAFLGLMKVDEKIVALLDPSSSRLTAPPFPATLHSPLISSSWHLYPLIKCDARRMALLKSGSQKMYSLKMNSGEEREADCDCSSGAVW